MSGFLLHLSFCSGCLLPSWPPSSPVASSSSLFQRTLSLRVCLSLFSPFLPILFLLALRLYSISDLRCLSFCLAVQTVADLVALLIHSKVGQSLQEDLRQPNFVLKASPVSQDITGDPPSPPPARPSLHFLLLFFPNFLQILQKNIYIRTVLWWKSWTLLKSDVVNNSFWCHFNIFGTKM